MTAHAIVPIHMNGEFKLFNDLMRSERFYKKDQRRVVAKVSQSVDFTAFVKEWEILLLLRIRIRIIKSIISFQNNLRNAIKHGWKLRERIQHSEIQKE